MKNIRILLKWVVLTWWMVPLTYIILLPMFYLAFGNFKEELEHLNEFTRFLITGEV